MTDLSTPPQAALQPMAEAQPQRLKIYVAGPDVFFPDAAKRFAVIKERFASMGLEAIIPFDDLPEGHPGHTPLSIYYQNLNKIQNCDAVVANIAPFRGVEPDSGTCMEIGYAKALGKYVVTYCEFSETTVSARTMDHFLRLGENDAVQDTLLEVMDNPEITDPVYPDGMKAENFNLPFNLMVWFAGPHVADSIYQAAWLVKENLNKA